MTNLFTRGDLTIRDAKWFPVMKLQRKLLMKNLKIL